MGQSLEDRDETLAGVVPSFAVGGPVAVLVASLLGYLVASVALRPVEAMRAAPARSRSAATPSSCRSARPTTRSAGWARP